MFHCPDCFGPVEPHDAKCGNCDLVFDDENAPVYFYDWGHEEEELHDPT